MVKSIGLEKGLPDSLHRIKVRESRTEKITMEGRAGGC